MNRFAVVVEVSDDPTIELISMSALGVGYRDEEVAFSCSMSKSPGAVDNVLTTMSIADEDEEADEEVDETDERVLVDNGDSGEGSGDCDCDENDKLVVLLL